MAETNAENRLLRPKPANEFVANARVLGPARARRDTDPLRVQGFEFGDGGFVVPFHGHVATEHAEVLDEIVGKRIVVIDDQQHAAYSSVARLRASTIAIALFTVSWYSLAGSESATIPAPA